MQGKRTIAVTVNTSVEKRDATKNSKLDLSVSFSVADVLGFTLYLCGLMANALYRPYAYGAQIGDANLLFAAFTFGQLPLFLLLMFFDRPFVHAGARFYTAFAAVSAVLSLANCVALLLGPIDMGLRMALWVVSGLGYGGLLLVWGVRLAVFPMKRIAFHVMLASLLGSVLFFAVMLVTPDDVERAVFAALPVASAACFVGATRVFPDELPPLVSIKRVYERKVTFAKLALFSAAYGLAYGLCFSYLPSHAFSGETLALSFGLGFLVAGSWLFANIFILKRTVPTNAMMLLALFLLAGGILLFVDVEALLVVALVLLMAFFLLHLDQCLRKTIKCTNAFQGKFFLLFAIEASVNLVGLGAGCLAGNVLFGVSGAGIAEKTVFFWLVAVVLVFVTMLCAVDYERKPATYAIPASQRPGSAANGDTIVVSALIKSIATDYGLSARQTEVLSLLAKGRNASVIEREFVISSNTAKSHIYTVYQKLGVHSQQELLDFIEGYRQA